MADKSAFELLEAAGYVDTGDGLYKPNPASGRPSNEWWRRTRGGFECYAVATGPILAAEDRTADNPGPWGQVVTAGPMAGRVKVPYRQTERFAMVSGAHPATHEEIFEWVWPEERIVEIYSHTADSDGNKWVKENGEYKRPRANA